MCNYLASKPNNYVPLPLYNYFMIAFKCVPERIYTYLYTLISNYTHLYSLYHNYRFCYAKKCFNKVLVKSNNGHFDNNGILTKTL